MCIPMEIPAKYMPFALYLLFSLFSGPQLSYAVSILVGYLHFHGYMDRLKPSSYFYEELESSVGMLNSVSRSRGWVLAGSALGHDAWIPVNAADASWGAGAGAGSGNRGGSWMNSFMGGNSGGGANAGADGAGGGHPQQQPDLVSE